MISGLAFREEVTFGRRSVAATVLTGVLLGAAAAAWTWSHALAVAFGCVAGTACALGVALRRGETVLLPDELLVRVGPVVRSVALDAVVEVRAEADCATGPTETVDSVWGWLTRGAGPRVVVLSRQGEEARITLVPTDDPGRLVKRLRTALLLRSTAAVDSGRRA